MNILFFLTPKTMCAYIESDDTLRQAMERTAEKRGSSKILTQYPEIMQEIRESDTLRRQWNKYSREYDYAKEISFDDTCDAIQKIMDEIIK